MARRIFVDPAPLRESRDFRLLFIGQMVSTLGSQLTVVAIPFQIYAADALVVPGRAGQHRPSWCRSSSVSLIGGSVGDAVDRRRCSSCSRRWRSRSRASAWP